MTTPSITYWHRLEPRPRSPSIAEGLAARVRDPLWMLTRQWQLGEFRGEDAGSPAYAEVSARCGPILGWRAEGHATRPVPSGVPLERLVESEPLGPDLSTRVELGQTFVALLGQAGASAALAAAFRAAYPLQAPSEDALASMADQSAARFLRVCGGRALDGVALYQAARNAQPSLPATPPVPAAEQAAVRTALTGFGRWVEDLFGELGVGDPIAWRPDRLEYAVEVVAAGPAGGAAVLSAQPDRDGDFDWYAFDLRPDAAPGMTLPAGAVQTVKRSILPGPVRFRGMPNARWWSFERGTTDFGDVDVDRRDLACLVVMDFMLVHGNDWFLVPFDQPTGTICRIDTLLVRDVFGGTTLIERADAAPAAPGDRWTMFSTTTDGQTAQPADFFVLPPSAATAAQAGAPIEEVRFLRDELANLMWAIEHTTENGIGQPWLGHERATVAAQVTTAPPAARRNGTDWPPLRYRIQTSVPENWIPFLPVAIDPQRGDIALERGALIDTPAGMPAEPVGRVLRPSSLGTSAYRIREEEVPRSGTRVERVVFRSRWIDGSTHVWVARRRSAGTGEGSSGLRFDLAEPAE